MKINPSELPGLIKKLETKASLLEPDSQARKKLFEQVNVLAEKFLGGLNERPVYFKDPREGAGLLDDPITDDPVPLKQILAA